MRDFLQNYDKSSRGNNLWCAKQAKAAQDRTGFYMVLKPADLQTDVSVDYSCTMRERKTKLRFSTNMVSFRHKLQGPMRNP